MRTQTRDYLAKLIEKHGPFSSVLDVGSLDVSGHVRDLFPEDTMYIGLDMRAGKNVDIVANGHELKDKFKETKFDLVLCFDTMEHDDKFWETMEGLKYVTKPGGWLMIGVPSRYCPEHDHPHDFWRFMPQAIPLMLDGFEGVETVVDRDDDNHWAEDEVYGWGRKPL